MPITGGYWRLCGIVGLACYTPDIATRALPCSSRCCQAQGHSRDDFRPRHPAAKLYPGYFEPSGIIAERETKRVHTEVWLVEQPTGGFTYLTAGIDATGQEVVSGTARVRGSSSKTTLAGLSHYRSSRSRMAPEQYAVSWQSCLTSQCP